MNIIAIDPGTSGGIACNFSRIATQAWKMPETQTDVLYLIRELRAKVPAADPLCCYIEDIPRGAGRSSGASQGVMFENFGYIKGVLQALAIRTIVVTPRKWQKPFSFGSKGTLPMPKGEFATKEEIIRIRQHNDRLQRDWKNKLKAEAQRRFPFLKVTLDTCDSLLILDYALMTERGLSTLSTPSTIPSQQQPNLLVA